MKVSAIICTHNRLSYLKKAVQSLLLQTLPEQEFEILVVDNASTDGTRAWITQIAAGRTNLKYHYESRLGLAYARNAGLAETRADLLAFLDDDAIAAEGWLENIVRKFDRYDNRLAAIGGKVDALWEQPPPSWLVPELWTSLSVLSWSSHDVRLDRQHCFVGANMAMRRSALAQIGGFHRGLGRKGARLLSNEELHVKYLLEASGYYTIFSPEVVVQHAVPRERMSIDWFRRRFYWQGVSDSLTQALIENRPTGFGAWIRSLTRNVISTVRITRRMLSRKLRLQRSSYDLMDDLHDREKLGGVVGNWSLLLKLARMDD